MRVEEKLDKAICEAETIFLQKEKELSSLCGNSVDVRAWLHGVRYVRNGRYKKTHTYATAWVHKQEIRFNPLWLDSVAYDFLVDMALHELGHLFAYKFCKDRGHGSYWKAIGSIVGYAQVGGTDPNKRRRYVCFAKHVGKYTSHAEILGDVLDSTINEVRKQSTVNSPVRLVWEICDANRGAARKSIIARCVSAGINKNTASTQYYHWKRANRYP